MHTDEIEILLVEDNRNDAEMTIRALRKGKRAFSIVHVIDGALAFDYLFGKGLYEGRDIARVPGLILLDVKMPKVSGIEVLKELKANELTRKIPVVMLTSSRENPDIDTCYEFGANSYIVKPVEFDAFIKTVSDMGIYWMTYNELRKP